MTKIKLNSFCFFTILFTFCYLISFGQNHVIDSLLKVLKATKEDTNKVNILYQLSEESLDNEAVLSYAILALQLSEKLNFKKGIANSLNNIGYVYALKGQDATALDYHNRSLKMQNEIGNKEGIASSLINIGNIYQNEGQIEKALDFYSKALKIQEEIRDKKGTSKSLLNIGNIYNDQGHIEKALEYYNLSFKLCEEIGDKQMIARLLSNIGLIYFYNKKQSNKAFEYLTHSLKIFEEIGDKQGVAQNLNAIAGFHYFKREEEKALEYLMRSLIIQEKIGDKNGMAHSLHGIAAIYLSQKKYKQAEQYCVQSLEISKELNSPENIRNASLGLSQIYKAIQDFQKSLQMFELYKLMSDSLNNLETQKASVKKEMQYEFEKKENAAKLEQEKKDAIVLEEKKKQKIIIWSVVGGLLLVIVFAGFMFNRYRVTQQQKKIIEQQKELVDAKNKDITDSIDYAKRIQDALLRVDDMVGAHFPDHFILYKPKDVISGDFYWALEKQGYLYIASADCTGHGVPGAMMSMLGIAFLNAITSTEEIFTPAEILEKLRERIINELRQTGKEEESKDGMDISLARINLANNELHWAGANNPLYYIKGGLLNEIKANKQPVGYYFEMQNFSNHIIQLEKGTSIFLFSDGYADQFSPNDKKLMKNKFKEIIVSVQNKPMPEQKYYLDTFIENWKSGMEQTDDILVIGVRV